MLRHIQVETFSRRPQQGRGQRARDGRKYQLTSRAVLSFELIPVLMFCMISKNQLLAQALGFPLQRSSPPDAQLNSHTHSDLCSLCAGKHSLSFSDRTKLSRKGGNFADS